MSDNRRRTVHLLTPAIRAVAVTLDPSLSALMTNARLSLPSFLVTRVIVATTTSAPTLDLDYFCCYTKGAMVRPTKSEEKRKSHMMRIRMTPGDKAVIEAAAQSDGLDVSSWARDALLRCAKRKGATVIAKWMRVEHGDLGSKDNTNGD